MSQASERAYSCALLLADGFRFIVLGRLCLEDGRHQAASQCAFLALRGGQDDSEDAAAAADNFAQGNSVLATVDDESGTDLIQNETLTTKHEGLVEFGFEKGKVFYNKAMVVNRDLSVLMLRIFVETRNAVSGQPASPISCEPEGRGDGSRV